MGCDIHMVLETKYKDEWVGVQTYDFIEPEAVCVSARRPEGSEAITDFYMSWWIRQRDYEFFSDLAGVRGHGPDPRGVPDDASALSRMMIDSWGGDGHSHTYIDALEFAQLFAKHNDEALKLIKQKMAGKQDAVEKWASELLNCPTSNIADYRLVIWFDN